MPHGSALLSPSPSLSPALCLHPALPHSPSPSQEMDAGLEATQATRATRSLPVSRGEGEGEGLIGFRESLKVRVRVIGCC